MSVHLLNIPNWDIELMQLGSPTMSQLVPAFEPARSPPQIGNRRCAAQPFKAQLLKWIGNKQRFAHNIISHFPEKFGTYHEPFLGAGGVLGVLMPDRAVASDCFEPLIGIWKELKDNPALVQEWYRSRWDRFIVGDKVAEYEAVKQSYNSAANPADLLFLSRSCYGGVVRFRLKDGYMSTPCGIHAPMHPDKFDLRVDEWHARVQGTFFKHLEYDQAIDEARSGDVVYCDPPYSYSQAILYGAQKFSLDDLFRSIEKAKARGVFVALSIDGSKKSGTDLCNIKLPQRLFARETSLDVGRSMLRRFQMEGKTLEGELVTDRLLLTH